MGRKGIEVTQLMVVFVLFVIVLAGLAFFVTGQRGKGAAIIREISEATITGECSSDAQCPDLAAPDRRSCDGAAWILTESVFDRTCDLQVGKCAVGARIARPCSTNDDCKSLIGYACTYSSSLSQSICQLKLNCPGICETPEGGEAVCGAGSLPRNPAAAVAKFLMAINGGSEVAARISADFWKGVADDKARKGENIGSTGVRGASQMISWGADIYEAGKVLGEWATDDFNKAGDRRTDAQKKFSEGDVVGGAVDTIYAAGHDLKGGIEAVGSGIEYVGGTIVSGLGNVAAAVWSILPF